MAENATRRDTAVSVMFMTKPNCGGVQRRRGELVRHQPENLEQYSVPTARILQLFA